MFQLLFIFQLLFMACQQVETVVNDQRGVHPVKYVLVERGEKNFPLDSLTSPFLKSVQHFEIDSDSGTTRYLSFLNNTVNTIYFYNYDTEEFLFKIQYEKKGPHGVGRPDGFHFHNFDSIFLYNYYRKTLYLTDSGARVYQHFFLNEVPPSAGNYVPTAQLYTHKPMVVLGDTVFISGYLGGEMSDENASNRPITKILNMKTAEVINTNRYSPPYLSGNWGGQLFRHVYSTFNPEKRRFVFSFPIDHYVYETSLLDTIMTPHYAGSRYFGDIKSLSLSKRIPPSRDMKAKLHSLNPSYYAILYDKYRKVYYRVAHLPISEQDFHHPDINISRMKQPSIIILDENLQYIGESLLPKQTYAEGLMFVSREGLNIRRWPHIELGEDTLRLKILVLEENPDA